MMKIHQILQNFKYIILENIHVLQIVKIFLFWYIFLCKYSFSKKKFVKIEKNSFLNNALLSLLMQSSLFQNLYEYIFSTKIA